MTTSASVPAGPEARHSHRRHRHRPPRRGEPAVRRRVSPTPAWTPAPYCSVAVVACMDARLDLHAALGLELGDCHTIRNAGGVVTDDVIRSLTISQRALGTRSVILIHHTGCGLESAHRGLPARAGGRGRPASGLGGGGLPGRRPGRTPVDAAGAHLAVPAAHRRRPRLRLRRDRRACCARSTPRNRPDAHPYVRCTNLPCTSGRKAPTIGHTHCQLSTGE